MPDARVLVGIAALGGLLLLGLVLFIVERRHSGRGRRQAPERLPLFGTEQLSIRTSHGYEEAGEEDGPAPSVRPTPSRAVGTSRNGSSPDAGADSAHGDGPRPVSARAEPFREPALPGERPGHMAPGPQPVTATTSRPSDFAPRTPTVRPAQSPVPAAAATQEYASAAMRPVATASAAHAESGDAGTVDAALVEGETLRFTVPVDTTVAFLPGHLEVVAGPDSGKEIRFVRSPGGEEVEVSFGRSEGQPHRHVQILARTVSRRHAIMSLIDEHWQLTNLSSTNPVVLNGRVLAGDEVAPLLVEGDRIEMGEVVFVYHDA